MNNAKSDRYREEKMLIDSNLIIYATQPQHVELRNWFIENASHYSAISRLETLGYQRLSDTEAQLIHTILDNLDRVAIDDVVLELAIGLRRQRKMSLGDALIAATCLAHALPLATANDKDFDWIEELEVYSPMGKNP